MRNALGQLLVKRYPALYGPDRWGIEPGDGWFAVFDALSHVLTSREAERDLRLNIRQIKEKLGTLRFHADGMDDFCFGAKLFADCMSGRLSEHSGRPGLPMHIGFYLCTLAPGENPQAEIQRSRQPIERWIAKCGPARAIALVRAAWPTTFIDVPAGHADLVDELLQSLTMEYGGSCPPSAVVYDVRFRGKGLVVEGPNLNDFRRGIIAVASRLATEWIDPETGATGPVDDLGRPCPHFG